MKSKIVKFHDTFHFQVDDTVLDSLAFKSFRPTTKNVQDFYKAGVRLFHVYVSGLPSGLKAPYSLFGETWFGDHKYDWTNLDKQIEFFKEINHFSHITRDCFLIKQIEYINIYNFRKIKD